MNPTYSRSDSKVEVTGFEARHYDFLMNLITGGMYPCFIRRVVKDMQIQPADSILDLGCGTGRNISLMNKYLSEKGRVLGLDIGSEMLEQAQCRFAKHPRVTIENRRIEEPLPFQDEFDKAFISCVLHGLIQEDRLKVIANARRRVHHFGLQRIRPEARPLAGAFCLPSRMSPGDRFHRTEFTGDAARARF
jgi:ubiquinone/menaquinone biosynthesis C-methylase UbiE